MRICLIISLIYSLSGCWISSISFQDKGGMPAEWKSFHVQTPENEAPNIPLDYPSRLAESIKDGIQNNTRLMLATSSEKAELDIESRLNNYSISPIAIQGNDNASQNRLSVQVDFTIYIKKPEEDILRFSSSRFVDYNANTDLNTVEAQILEEVSTQIVQDVINKLLSNW